jgi:predicted nucleotide-binding protein
MMHLSGTERKNEPARQNVFIGHGHSSVWREFKDFITDRIGLPYDEFNRVPVAGTSNVARLSQMMDTAAIAFLILTAEDERVDGQWQARMNVVHEAGLFQGLLESKCYFGRRMHTIL